MSSVRRYEHAVDEKKTLRFFDDLKIYKPNTIYLYNIYVYIEIQSSLYMSVNYF